MLLPSILIAASILYQVSVDIHVYSPVKDPQTMELTLNIKPYQYFTSIDECNSKKDSVAKFLAYPFSNVKPEVKVDIKSECIEAKDVSGKGSM